jgi:hypothetical protein
VDPSARRSIDRAYWALALALVLVGLWLRWPALAAPFADDDFVHQTMLAGAYPVPRAWWDLFQFWAPGEVDAHRAVGTLPWWTSPGFHGGVFRPLASALMGLDHRLAPGSSGFAHAHSLLWWVGLVGAAAFAFRRLLPRPLALVALTVLALDDGTVVHVVWVANRCTIVAVTLGLLSLVHYVRWREHGSRRDAVTAAGWAGLAFAAGEYALALVAYAAAFELLKMGRDGQGVMRRMGNAAPIVVPAALYLVAHASLGYGFTGAAVYASPIDDPIGYSKVLFERFPVLFGNVFFGMPAGDVELAARPTFSLLGLEGLQEAGWMFWIEDRGPAGIQRAHQQVGWVCVGVLVALVALARRHWSSAEAVAIRWFGFGSVLSLGLVAIAPPHPRLLAFSQVGAAVVVAGILVGLARLGARSVGTAAETIDSSKGGRSGGKGILRVLGWAAFVPFAYAHLIVDPVWTTIHQERLIGHYERQNSGFDDLPPVGGRDVIVVASIDHTTVTRGATVLRARGRAAPRSWQALSMAGLPHTIQRVDERSFVLTPVGGQMISSDDERTFRTPDDTLVDGSVLESGGMRVEIVRAIEGRAAQVKITMEHELEHYLWLVNDRGLRVLPAPPLGGTTVAPIPRMRR